MATPITFPPVQYEVISLTGGMDTVTPTLSLKPGVLRDGVNFEVSSTGGYTRIAGYERYDGRTSPSTATYTAIAVIGSTQPVLGSTVTGVTSSATGVLIAQTPSYFVLTKVTGTFQAGESLEVAAVPVGTMSDFYAVTDSYTDATYLLAAADEYRADIAAPTGSGAIRGVFVLNDNVYCFRNNTLATSCDLWKATTGGWTQVAYKYKVSFTAGTTEPADGATLTQGGVTATIRRVLTQSGAWSGTAAGEFIIDAPSGGNFAAGAATATGGCTVTLSAIQTAITVSPNGRYQFELGNFAGGATTQRIYGCDGVNKGFEFDGTTYVPITTGTATDTPKFVLPHANHLFWAFGSSLVSSAIGDPYNYTALLGASEIAVGDTITGLLTQPGSSGAAAMAVYSRSRTHILYGTSATDWNLTTYSQGTGALPYTAQNMNQSFVLDDRGISGLATSQSYGNFDQATLTSNIRSYIADKRSKVNTSSINREKSQYRLFFNDGFGLYSTIVNGNYLGSIPIQFPTAMYCAFEGELSSGAEIVLCGGEDGMVYLMDTGTSFDGDAINYSLLFPYNPMRMPRVLKRYRRASAEITGSSYISFEFGYNLGYSRSDYAMTPSASYTNTFSPAFWDSGTWDTMVWDGISLAPTEVEMLGTAENVQLAISGNSALSQSFTINSIIVHYTVRRAMR